MSEASSATGERRALLSVVFLAVLQLGAYVWQLTRGVEYLASHVTIDDTYYYLQTAWQSHRAGFVTFDGLHRTSGVQFLWFWIVWLLALFAPSKSSLLFVTLGLCGVLNVACYVPLWRLGKTLGNASLSVVLASSWLVVSLGPVYSIGLENSLHALIFWWATLEALRCLLAAPGQYRLLRLAVPLALNVWVRLDGGLFSAAIFAVCTGVLYARQGSAAAFWRAHGRDLGSALLLCGVAFAIQAGGYLWMGGSVLPISALVKASGSLYRSQQSSLSQLVAFTRLSVPPAFRSPGVCFALAMTLLPLGWWWKQRGERAKLAWWQIWALLAVSITGYHLTLLHFGVPYTSYMSWYRTPMFVFWILTLGGLAAELLSWAERRRPRLAAGAAVALSLTIGVGWSAKFCRKVRGAVGQRTYLTDAYGGARWVSAHAPQTTRLAAWNAGLVGYFCDRTLVNMDGLVNSLEYHRQVLQSPDVRRATRVYLNETKIDYIFDVVETDDVRALVKELTVVRSFSPPGAWEGWKLWRVNPNVPPIHE